MKKLTPELKADVLAMLQHAKNQADGPRTEYLDKYVLSAKYRALKLPSRISESEDIPKGFTPWVEPVLQETIKEAKPQVRDSFESEGRIAFAFRGRGWNRNAQIDELMTMNLNRLFLDEQDGYAVIDKVIDDSMGPGSAFAKVFVDEQTTRDEAHSDDWISLVDFMPMIAEGWKIDPPADFADKRKGSYKGFEWRTVASGESVIAPGLSEPVKTESREIKGTIPLIKVDKRIKTEFVQSNDLYFDTSFGEDFSKCRYVCHRILTTIGEAEKRGFSFESLKNAGMVNRDEILAELSLVGINDINQENDSLDEREQKIYIYEHYFHTSKLDKGSESKLYQAVATENEILEINEIPFIPFVHAKKQSVVGSFYGRGFFDEAKPFQDALTKKARQADTVATLTAWQRHVAVKGAYDRQSLLNVHRPGAVVEVSDPAAIQPLPVRELDNTFMQSYNMLKESEQQSLRRGFGSANLSDIPPIATATVAMGIYHDSQRGQELSRSYADTLIKPLYKLIYETMRYENWPLEDENGQIVEGVNYPAIYEMSIDIQTAGDDAAQVMRLQEVVQTAVNLEQIQGNHITPQNKYEILKFMLTRADLNANDMVSDPSQQAQDVYAVKMQHELDAMNQTANKMNLQTMELQQWKLASEIMLNEVKSQETILNGAVEREIAQQDSLAKMRSIMDVAQIKSEKNAIENKRVNYDAILGAHEKRHDNAVNGIM